MFVELLFILFLQKRKAIYWNKKRIKLNSLTININLPQIF